MSSYHEDRFKHGGGEQRRYLTKENRTLEELKEVAGVGGLRERIRRWKTRCMSTHNMLLTEGFPS